VQLIGAAGRYGFRRPAFTRLGIVGFVCVLTFKLPRPTACVDSFVGGGEAMSAGSRQLLALLGTVGILAGSCCTGFGLWFAPGWANGWPFGLHRNVVWPAGLACVVFLTVMAVAANLVTALRQETDPPGPIRSRRCLWASLGVSAGVAVVAFLALRSQAVAIWP
jgi:hypothetical protein